MCRLDSDAMYHGLLLSETDRVEEGVSKPDGVRHLPKSG